jgi:solute:Na+ symporter, SSS family
MVDLFIVGCYFAVMLTVGWRARRGSADAYWVAERRYGTVPVAASLVATIFGASSTVGIIGLGYSRGLTGAWWSLVGGLALVPFALFLAARVRRLEVYTLPDILHRAFGGKVALAGASVIAVAWCGVVAAQIVAGALLLGSVLALPFQGSLAAVAAIFVLYTLWGGQISVMRTDLWQVLLFAFGLLATLVLVLRAGWEAGGFLWGVDPGHLAFPVSEGFGWYQVLVFYPLIVGMPYLVGPDMYSRVLCARDGGAARSAALLAALLVIPLSFLLALLGLLIHARFPGLSPEAALPVALTHLAPAGLRGIVVVGVLGAIMSSADTTLVSASTILSRNVVSPLAKLGRQEELRVTRVFVVLVGVLAWGLASFQQGIIASLLMAYTVFVGGIALPTLASFWKERLGVTSRGAFWAVVMGGVMAVLGEFRQGALLRTVVGDGGVKVLETLLGPAYGSLLPLVVSALVLLVVSRLDSSGGSQRGV